MRLFFTKMHGLGNDYIYMDGFSKEMSNLLSLSEEEKRQLAVRMSRRHTGIGADGLIFILPSRRAAFRMVMYNADGSRGAMCGNGIRCAARYAYDRQIVSALCFRVETDSGIRQVRIRDSGYRYGHASGSKDAVGKYNEECMVCVEMGAAENIGERKVSFKDVAGIPGDMQPVQFVAIGNRHCVIFAEDMETFPLQQAAEVIHQMPGNEAGINVEIAAVEKNAASGKIRIQMRVFERGSGETMACGTGACAVCAAAVWQGYCRYDENVEIRQPGGTLLVAYLADGRMMMEGPTAYVFEGQCETEL